MFKYLITAIVAVAGVAIGVRILKQVKPDWADKLVGLIVG